MKYSSVVFGFLALLVSCSVVAQKNITTIGVRSCETWVADKKAASLAESFELKWVPVRTSSSWLAGYVTGFNEGFYPEKNLLDLIDLQVVEDWVDSFCQKNPKSDVRRGVHKLFEELDKWKK